MIIQNTVNGNPTDELANVVRQIKECIPRLEKLIFIGNMDVSPEIRIMRKSMYPMKLEEALKIGTLTQNVTKSQAYEYLNKCLPGVEIDALLETAEQKFNKKQKTDFLDMCGIKDPYFDEYIISVKAR